MKILRGFLVLTLSALAVLGLLAVLRPVDPARARSAAVGDHVILSEVFYDAAGSSDNGLEWVELYNPTSSAIDLSEYSLGNGGDYYTYSRVQLTEIGRASCRERV